MAEPKSSLPLRLAIALASVSFAATVELLPAFGARLRVVLVLTAVWFGFSLWVGRRALLAAPYRPVVPILLLVSYAFIALAAIAVGESPVATNRLAAYCAMSVGWATFFLLVGTQRGGLTIRAIAPSRRAVFILVGAGAALLLIAHALATPRWPLISDEAIYVLQSEWFFRPNHAWQVPREIADFFVMRKLGYNSEAGHFYGMYPPGWPAVLATLNAVGLRWWAPVILGAGTIALTYFIGVRVHSRAVGGLAAALLALQQWFVIDHAGYMSDGLVTFTTVAGAAALLAAESARGARLVALGGIAGLALGMGVATRPLSGIAVALSLVAWILLRRRMTLRSVGITGTGLLLGGLLPAVLLLRYNAVTNGEPLRLGYQAINGHGYDLGFGVRGFTGYTASLERVQIPIIFTPNDAVEHLFLRLSDIAYAWFGIGLLLPLLALALVHRVPLRARLVAPFFLLPAAYFFYWGSSVRFYGVLLPLVMIGCAVLVLDLTKRDSWVVHGMCVCALVGSAFFAIPYRVGPGVSSPWTGSAYFRDPGRMGTLDSLTALGESRGPLIVFVRQQPNPYDTSLDRLQLLNSRGLSSRVLVARDLGARNAELRARYPERAAYIVEDRGRASVARITPVE